MQTPTQSPEQWRGVDEGWGRRAAEFATLSEPSNMREYVSLHHRLGVSESDRLIDLACGSGLALELATLRGATVAGIDASTRLVAIARDRVPQGDVRVGDMHVLPWEDASFDVVTSFRGIWGTTPEVLAEARRVLVPGGRIGFTVWGHIKKSPGAWSLSPFRLAEAPQVENQANMVALGRPGAGEALLEHHGFVDIERMVVPCALEFADPATYALALASTGPAYEAIQRVGEEEFVRWATELAHSQVREGLPLRAEIDLVGYIARTPATSTRGGRSVTQTRGVGFLGAAEPTLQALSMLQADVEDVGYVMNTTQLWAHLPSELESLFDLMAQAKSAAALTLRERGILVTAMAATMGDSYCSLAWGQKLSENASAEVAAGVLSGNDAALTPAEQALAGWARAVTSRPNTTTPDEVASLREVGYDDRAILAITVFVALRMAFSTVNDALGVRPDAELARSVPPDVRAAVTWGRPVVD